ncbi:helix-turn-helix domain-containing protein [Streptomyces nigrescens]|uniref:helix-turn-helix domain-containing protein n=1 Tax=Streptomyces nigrescens TaxID=1920 RepID=UPI00225A8676|nr:helix-turn-helix domain-containing protein [Streptomyces libani]MCX5450282.1 helix-turn-helix domain-containing protein [Streptomyces libani]
MTSPHPMGLDRGARRAGRRHTALVRLLTALKDSCGLTFTELAERTAEPGAAFAVSASTLKRAVGLDAVPQEHVVAAFTRACDATAEQERQALGLWQAARAEDRGILATLQAPSVTNIRTTQDLTAALAAAYERAGAPPLRLVLERATTDQVDGALVLPLTSLWRITRREGRGPATWEQCEAYLRGLGVTHSVLMRLWHEAFTRARNPSSAPADLGPVTRAMNEGRLANLHYSTKINKRFGALLNRMTRQEVETALTIGIAYLTTENLRPATTPATYDHIEGVGRELFLPPAPDAPARTAGEPGSPERSAVGLAVSTATPAPDDPGTVGRKTFVSLPVAHFLRAEARRNGTGNARSTRQATPA